MLHTVVWYSGITIKYAQHESRFNRDYLYNGSTRDALRLNEEDKDLQVRGYMEAVHILSFGVMEMETRWYRMT